jgi:fumarate reductase flavoprotein subunit
LKKILVYVLILSMIASMHVGCNQSSNQINNQDSNESSNQAPSDSSAIKFKAGTYVGESEGMKGPIKVQVTVDEEKIKEVKILEHVDSERLFNYANESIPAAIVENQSVAVDAVAGATMSSIGIIGAAKKALSQSGADLKLLDVKKEKPALVKGEDEYYDVVVAGAGASGLSAAIELAKNEDINILVLEKMPFTGGSLALSGGLFWTGNGSKYVTEESFTPESLLEWFEMRSETEANAPLVKHIADIAGETFDYLIDNGAPWDVDSVNETYPNSGIYRFETNRGATLTKFRDDAAGNQAAEFLINFAKEKGAEIRVNSKVTSLIVEDNVVKGVKVEDNEKEYTVNAKKVILATGGFGNNPKLLKELDPDSATKWPFLSAGSTGDGIEMTRELGVEIVGNGVMSYEALTPKMGYKGVVGSLVWVPELIVNKEGKRFVDETGQSTDIALQTYLQTDDISFGIHDSQGDRIEDFEAGVEMGLIYKADTLEELADKIGLNKENFVATVEKYNTTVANGTEDEFGSVLSQMKPPTAGPFYAVPIHACIIGTMPGLKVDENCQVIGANGEPIENLFAAGELMFGNVFNRVYPATGTAIALAIYTGRIAGETANNQLK